MVKSEQKPVTLSLARFERSTNYPSKESNKVHDEVEVEGKISD